MDHDDQPYTFNNFGPVESPERLEYNRRKEQMEKSFIKDKLKEQIRQKQEMRRKELEDTKNYGQKMNELANSMKMKEEERLKKKEELQRDQLKAAWSEQRRQKDELNKIERIFK